LLGSNRYRGFLGFPQFFQVNGGIEAWLSHHRHLPSIIELIHESAYRLMLCFRYLWNCKITK
jgi:hypothetical protein